MRPLLPLILAVLSLAAGCTNAPPGPLVGPTDPTRAPPSWTPYGVDRQAPGDED